MSDNKVVRYKRKPKAAVIIFALVLAYIICFVVMYSLKSKVQTYEVNIGSLTNNATFTAIAVRSEDVYNSEYAGNINYYQREGTRVKAGDTVYTVDETGRVSEILKNYTIGGENSLSSENLSEIKIALNNYKSDYDGSNFFELYDLKSDLNTTVLQSINDNIMSNLDSIVESTGSQNLFRTIGSKGNGIVVYSIDGYEGINEENIQNSDFDKSNYNRTNLNSGDIIVNNNPAYKLVTDESWYMLIKLTKDDIDDYGLSAKTSITIKFKKDSITTSCGFSIINKDGNYYGKLTLNKYMIRYVTDRFLDIEIVSSGKTGMKIPVSAITENEFYVIPKEYLTTGGNSNDIGVIVESYDSNNKLITSFKEVDIYKTTQDEIYVSKDDFTQGTSIIKTDAGSRYVIGSTKNLKGVYCVNTGYTVFNVVEIIDENNEYYIIKQNVSHGISVYDRIVLDAANFSPNEMIY
ncbi:MAG: HlyD family efflux transporter periplasmic adaptor subunit [Eubacteriales bacterium]|nr:HlyD family efflux transporter periplasmic adaptor subunit [Eubacteriales bacterium]